MGDPEFHEIEDQLFDAIVVTPYRAVIKNGDIHLADPNGFPGEIILVEPAEPEDLASISTTTFYPNVFVPHGFRIALILWLPCLVALVQRGTDPTNSSASIPNPLS